LVSSTKVDQNTDGSTPKAMKVVESIREGELCSAVEQKSIGITMQPEKEH